MKNLHYEPISQQQSRCPAEWEYPGTTVNKVCTEHKHSWMDGCIAFLWSSHSNGEERKLTNTNMLCQVEMNARKKKTSWIEVVIWTGAIV